MDVTAAGVKRTPGLGSNPTGGPAVPKPGVWMPPPPTQPCTTPESTRPGHRLQPRPGVGTRLTGLADEDLDGRAGRALADDVVGREDHLVASVFLQVCKGTGTGSACGGPCLTDAAGSVRAAPL